MSVCLSKSNKTEANYKIIYASLSTTQLTIILVYLKNSEEYSKNQLIVSIAKWLLAI